MRPEKLYLTDIVDAADANSRFVATSATMIGASLQQLIVYGRARAGSLTRMSATTDNKNSTP